MKSKISLTAISVVAVLLSLDCSHPTQTAGNGSGTGNALVGILYQPDGKTPAAGVRVHIRPKTSLADTTGAGLTKRLASLAAVDSVVTDSAGRYAFDTTIDTGTYVITSASGNNVVLIDYVAVKTKAATDTLAPDTLKPAGALKGVIRLSEGGDPRKVFVLAFGIDRFARVNADGSFKFQGLAQAAYDLRLISSLDNYGVLDTVGVPVRSADTTDLDTISLPFTGIPTPKGLTISYDTLKQIVTLTWNKADTALAKTYNVYRRNVGLNTVLARINTNPVIDTVYRDSTGVQDSTYEYRVAAVNQSATEGTQSAATSMKVYGVFTVIDSIVKGYAVGVDGNFGQFGRGVLDSTGNFYITDNTNKWLQKLDPTGNFIFKITMLSEPIAITNYKDSALYACDYSGRKILKASLQGNIDTIFSTIGRPGGVCTRGDTVFVSSDSGIEIFNLVGTRLDSLPFAFNVSLSQPDIIAETNGNLYVVEDRGLFEVNLRSRAIKNIWTFKNANENQQSRIAIYNGDTLAIIALYTPQSPIQTGPQSINTNLYMINTNGNQVGRWYTKDFYSGITTDSKGRLISFSDGRILFLHR